MASASETWPIQKFKKCLLSSSFFMNPRALFDEFKDNADRLKELIASGIHQICTEGASLIINVGEVVRTTYEEQAKNGEVDKEIYNSVINEEAEKLQEIWTKLFDGLRGLFEKIMRSKPEQMEYSITVLISYFEYLGLCWSFFDAMVTAKTLFRLGFKDKLILSKRNIGMEVMQHYMCTMIGRYCATIGESRWLNHTMCYNDDFDDFVKEIMRDWKIEWSTLDYLMKRIATENGLFRLRDTRFAKFGLNDKKELDREPDNIMRDKLPEAFNIWSSPVASKPSRSGRSARTDKDNFYTKITECCNMVVTNCKDTCLHKLYDLLTSPVVDGFPGKDESGRRMCIPGMPDLSYAKIQKLKTGSMATCDAGRHDRFYAANERDKVFPVDFNNTCAYCGADDIAPNGQLIRGSNGQYFSTIDRSTMMYYPIMGDIEQIIKEEPDEDVEYNPLTDLWEKLQQGDYYMECSGLGPLETHLLRLIIMCELGRRIDNWDVAVKCGTPNYSSESFSVKEFFHYQVICVMCGICNMLYPHVPAELSIDAAQLFVYSVLGMLNKLLRTEQDTIEGNADFVTSFATIMGDIIPAVHDRLVEIGIACGANKGKKSDTESKKSNIIRPFSAGDQLIDFLVHPRLREKYPLIYNFLRLSGKFHNVYIIMKVAEVVKEMTSAALERKSEMYTMTLGDYVDDLHLEEEDTSNKITELVQFMKDVWNDKALPALRGPVTAEIAEMIKQTTIQKEENDQEEEEMPEEELWNIIKEMPCKAFLPNAMDSWLAMEVLVALSGPHNEFIRVLQDQGKNIIVRDTRDFNIYSSERIDLDYLSRDIIKAFHGKLNEHGLPTWDSEAENEFVKSMSYHVFKLVLHSSLNPMARPQTNAISETDAQRFCQVFVTKKLTSVQKEKLYEHVQKLNKSSNLKFACERLMRYCLKKTREGSDDAFRKSFYQEFNVPEDVKMTPFEKEGISAFAKVRAVTGSDKFTMAHIPEIYQFLQTAPDVYGKRSTKNVSDEIVEKKAKSWGISDADIAAITCPVEKDLFPAILSIIPKILSHNDEQRPGDNSRPELLTLLDEFSKSTWGRLALDNTEKRCLQAIKANLPPDSSVRCLIAYYREARRASLN